MLLLTRFQIYAIIPDRANDCGNVCETLHNTIKHFNMLNYFLYIHLLKIQQAKKHRRRKNIITVSILIINA